MESCRELDKGRSWALLRYYTTEGLKLGQQGVGTHNELGHAFTDASTWRTIDRASVSLLYIPCLQSNKTQQDRRTMRIFGVDTRIHEQRRNLLRRLSYREYSRRYVARVARKHKQKFVWPTQINDHCKLGHRFILLYPSLNSPPTYENFSRAIKKYYSQCQ